jgi:hypothetical protein
VPDDPSEEDIMRARDLILEMFCDFPFEGEADLAHAVGLFLLPFVRDIIDGPTPLHSVDGSIPGAGKSLLVHCALFPSTGRQIPTMTEASNEEEWRKRITSALGAARSIIFFDNIQRGFDSAQLSAVLTAQVWEDRLLGKSTNVRYPNRAIWASTGNNPQHSAEILRRIVRVRLVPEQERPWDRDGKEFRHPDLKAWVKENRTELVRSALVLVKAWFAQGCPPGDGKLGSYESWARTIGGILKVAGIPGFLSNAVEIFEASDVVGGAMAQLVAKWAELFGEREIKAGELLSAALAIEDLELRGAEANAQKKSLGHLLKRNKDRVFDGYRVTQPGTKGKPSWQLVRVVPGGSEGFSTTAIDSIF